MKYEKPIMDIIEFEVKEVITTSLTDGEVGGTQGSNWSDWF